MKILLIVLLVAAIALGILGFLIKAALWLAFIGIVLFVGTIAFWVLRSKWNSRGQEIESR
ncbi:hypothetical protein [Demequina litorisediminis]|uniref:Uncharacterized protein n=1 Tax=Demequina litorisediminis TaxID=1849022 RepID=A0ABQ6IC87_9MICO|nr:hypothetical protein [Demequina litorisediminis]GMA35299.1 hypothetical protein GCM10025876_15030 [Demequina litorisediminis]